MLPRTHHTPPINFKLAKERIAVFTRHVRMPRRETRAALVGHGQIPFGVGCYSGTAGRICCRWVDDLDVFLKGLVEHVVAVGFCHPGAHAGCVGHEVVHAWVIEDCEPEVCYGWYVVYCGYF